MKLILSVLVLCLLVFGYQPLWAGGGHGDYAGNGRAVMISKDRIVSSDKNLVSREGFTSIVFSERHL